MALNTRQVIKLTTAIVLTIMLVSAPANITNSVGISKFAMLAFIWIAALFGIWLRRNKS